MKKLFVLMAALSLLFLASCQQSECVDPQDGLTNKQDNPSGFKLLGDPRDPAEFMSSEEIEMIQSAFKNMEGKTLKNEVVKLPETRGSSIIVGDKWLLQENDIPIVNINGQYLFIKIVMLYYADGTFENTINYRFGPNGKYLKGWYTDKNEGVKNVYTSGDTKMLLEYGVSFEVELDNHPQYTKAIVTFPDPIQMQWDQRNGGDYCEVVLYPQRIKVTYK